MKRLIHCTLQFIVFIDKITRLNFSPVVSRILTILSDVWTLQGGNVDGDNRHNVYFNEYDSLDYSPIGWHTTEPVEPDGVDPWMNAVGGGIY
jgi:hypothetical protein